MSMPVCDFELVVRLSVFKRELIFLLEGTGLSL